MFPEELRAPRGQEPHITCCHKLEGTEPSSEGTQCNQSHKLIHTQILTEVRFEGRGGGPWNRNRQVGCGELCAHTLGAASGVPQGVEGDNVGDEEERTGLFVFFMMGLEWATDVDPSITRHLTLWILQSPGNGEVQAPPMQIMTQWVGRRAEQLCQWLWSQETLPLGSGATCGEVWLYLLAMGGTEDSTEDNVLRGRAEGIPTGRDGPGSQQKASAITQ